MNTEKKMKGTWFLKRMIEGEKPIYFFSRWGLSLDQGFVSHTMQRFGILFWPSFLQFHDRPWLDAKCEIVIEWQQDNLKPRGSLIKAQKMWDKQMKQNQVHKITLWKGIYR